MTNALIIGGGIAGAATALALRKAGIDSVVYESHPTGADDIGAFLMIMPNGLDALEAIDARATVEARSFPATSVEHIGATGAVLSAQPIGHDTPDADAPRTLRRADLYRALHDEVIRHGGRIEHGKRLVTARTAPCGKVTARFADGTTAEGDILVGADGIHSATRAVIDPGAPRPRYTGQNIAYGYTRDSSIPAAPESYRMIHGSRAFFGYTTSPDGETFWFAHLPGDELIRSDTAVATPAYWRQQAWECFADDRTPAAYIVAATGDDIRVGSTYDVPTTPVWHNASMVLVGDAAHAASPSAAQGASMALEDSVVLAQCLRDLPGTHEAFGTYTRLRRERVERLVEFSASQALDQSRMLKERADARSWLYSHHIDWDARVSG